MLSGRSGAFDRLETSVSDQSVREAACACGDLKIRLRGDPAYVSSCCCHQCQRRSGSLFAVTAYFADHQVEKTEGAAISFHRIAESGNGLTFHFCPRCGYSVWWEAQARPGSVCVAGGAFADAGFPSPQRMIWTEYRHPWICTPDDLPVFPKGPS